MILFSRIIPEFIRTNISYHHQAVIVATIHAAKQN